MTAVGSDRNASTKHGKLVAKCDESHAISDILKGNTVDDVPQRTRRLLLILPGILMGFIALCLLTAYFCVTQSKTQTEEPYDRSRIHEEKFLLVASHDGHRTWNHVTVDGTENIVEVEVPTFGQFQQSIIIYDFEEGFMANKDIVGKKCFIKRIHEHLEKSMKNLDNFKGANLTIYLDDIIMTALPGVITPALLRSTAGGRLADMCSGLASYWLVQPTIQNERLTNNVMKYNIQDGPVITMDNCDVRVADILSGSLLCVQFSPKMKTPSSP